MQRPAERELCTCGRQAVVVYLVPCQATLALVRDRGWSAARWLGASRVVRVGSIL